MAGLAKLRPLNPYGWSKHLFDRRVARMVAEHAPQPTQWAGLKFFNVYGPNEYHKGSQASVALQIHDQMLLGDPVKLFRSHNPEYPDGGQRRDFIWIEDCVAVVQWLLDDSEASGIFNVGTGESRTFLDLATAVSQAMKEPLNVQFIDTPEEMRDRYQYFTEAKVERLRDAGFTRAFTPLEEGVRLYVQQYLSQPEPFR
jgi:ADP-L-glycero-D-manno-heptose 6-epimerase